MVRKLLINRWKEAFMVLVALAVMAGTSYSATFTLRADVATKTMPDGEVIPVWGFALVSYDIGGGLVTGDDTVKLPGPTLAVPPGQGLTINVTNNLPAPVSIVIPGQVATMTPVWVDTAGTVVPSPSPQYRPNDFTSRVRSLTHEAAANGGTAVYTWTNLKAGTYLYQSGTDPAVQVQMGLCGAVKKDAVAGEIYTGKTYNAEAVVLFSEIDPDLHHSVATGNYTGIPARIIPGYTPPTVISTFTSTIDYWPRYFLINGEGHPNPIPGLAGPFSAGQKVLIRMLNAGLQTHVPAFLGTHISLIAEDGNPYLYAKELYAVHLPAGKTIDAIFTPASPGDYPVFDRKLNTTNAGVSPGGMIAKLTVEAAVAPPVANNDTYSTFKNVPLTVAAPGVLGNDTNPSGIPLSAVWDSGPANGTLVCPTNALLNICSNGSFTYTPNTDYFGPDSFTYRASNGGLSNIATVSITVINNDPPEANDDPTIAGDPNYTVNEDNTLNVTALLGVLANDTDLNGDMLTAKLATGPTNGTLTLNANGAFSYKPKANFNGTDSFTYKASDSMQDSVIAATVAITVTPVVDPPVAVNDVKNVTRNSVNVFLNLTGNDYAIDAGTNINGNSITITTPPNKGGTVTVVLNGVNYTPKRAFRGTEVFYYKVSDNRGLLSNAAKVTINVK